jgi:hypothetical protein
LSDSIYQDIHSSKSRHHVSHQFVRFTPDIPYECLDLEAFLMKLIPCLIDTVTVSTVERHCRASRAQRASDLKSKSASAPGYQGHLSRQVEPLAERLRL